MTRTTFSEKELNINLAELSLEIIREFYVAAKKASIYSHTHPLAYRAIERLFSQISAVFKIKRFLNIHIEAGHLYALNIELKPSVFSDQIVEYMQLLDIKDILFGSGMTVAQLALFLDKFVKRIPTGIYQNLLHDFLAQKGIDSIKVNSEEGFCLFEKGVKYRAGITGDFSVRNILGQSIGERPDILADMLSYDDDHLDEFINEYGIDFYPRLVAYLIPEKMSGMKSEIIINIISEKLSRLMDQKNDEINKGDFESMRNLLGVLNLHPERENIFAGLEAMLSTGKISKDIYSEILPHTSTIRIESIERINQFLEAAFNREMSEYDLTEFENLFGRIIRTGQKSRAESVINALIIHLAGPHFELRERALILFRYIIDTYRQETGKFLFDYIIKKINDFFANDQESFEFSDLIWALSQTCLSAGDYQRLSALCAVLSTKYHQTDGIRCYDSVVAKKSIEELNRSEIIDQLMNELLKGDCQNTKYIKNIFAAINSEDAAYSLSLVISHESRQVRMNILKILAEMGKPALRICAGILSDDVYFAPESGRREIPDDKWYIVRNAIFVLGSLEDPEGCHALRKRISVDDIRVKLAIVAALEKIKDESAADLLIVLADDNDREVREAAIIAVGLNAQADIVPELINLAEKRNTEIISIISTLGKLGGVKAREFLSMLLVDNNLLSKYTSNRSSRDDIKLAIIKALGRIGDSESMETVKNFSSSLSSTQKIFFGGSKISRIAEDILKRNRSLP